MLSQGLSKKKKKFCVASWKQIYRSEIGFMECVINWWNYLHSKSDMAAGGSDKEGNCDKCRKKFS